LIINSDQNLAYIEQDSSRLINQFQDLIIIKKADATTEFIDDLK
jgi:hypothetical protein